MWYVFGCVVCVVGVLVVCVGWFGCVGGVVVVGEY